MEFLRNECRSRGSRVVLGKSGREVSFLGVSTGACWRALGFALTSGRVLAGRTEEESHHRQRSRERGEAPFRAPHRFSGCLYSVRFESRSAHLTRPLAKL